MAFLFGSAKQPSPKEQVREWTSSLSKEQRGIDREISKIQREEAKVVADLKKAAKVSK